MLMRLFTIFLVLGYATMALFGAIVMHADMNAQHAGVMSFCTGLLSHKTCESIADVLTMIAQHFAFFGMFVQSGSLASVVALLQVLMMSMLLYFFIVSLLTHFYIRIFATHYVQESIYRFTRTAIQLVRRWIARLSLSPAFVVQH